MVFVMPLMLLTTSDVLSRSVLNKPLPGVIEMSEYMLAITILLGASFTQQVKGHVSIDFLTSHLRPRPRETIAIFTTLLTLLIVTIVVWQGFALGTQETGVSDMLRIPKKPFKFLVGVGGLLLWTQLLVDLIDTIVKVARGRS